MSYSLKGKTAIVTGGSRGLGRGVVESLAEQGLNVIAVARSQDTLSKLADEINNVKTVAADITDQDAAYKIIGDYNPDILILVAGASPVLKPIQEQDWDSFSTNWNVDVKGTLFWTQAAFKLPMKPGSTIIIMSSGAAVRGSPASGGYAGAKATQSLIGEYISQEAKRSGLNLNVKILFPQITPNTDLGRAGIHAYAARAGITDEQFIKKLGPSVTPKIVGESIIRILTDLDFAAQNKFWITGSGLKPLED